MTVAAPAQGAVKTNAVKKTANRIFSSQPFIPTSNIPHYAGYRYSAIKLPLLAGAIKLFFAGFW
ncbi:MAG: hypothetical protein HYV36_07700 [Lentisphaerae bacterium]|nr:hypothetical protein [Lentisphaerota bacterium]